MNPSQTAWESWIHNPSDEDRPPTEITIWMQKLWVGVHTRVAQEAGFQHVPPCNDDFERKVHGESGRIAEVTYLGDGTILFRDRFGSNFLASIADEGGEFLLRVRRVVINVRRGAIDEPRGVLFATHHTVESAPGSHPIRDVIDGSIEQALLRLLAMLNESIDQPVDPPSEYIEPTAAMRHLSYVDAATLSYTSGILGAALFMAMSIGPGWLGFLATYLPMSILTVGVAATHE